MGMYEVVLGVGIIIFLGIVWTILMQPFSLVVGTYTNMTNSTEVTNQYNIAENLFYFTYFLIVLVIIGWIIKTSIRHQETENVYG